jgi:hypothetical protein
MGEDNLHFLAESRAMPGAEDPIFWGEFCRFAEGVNLISLATLTRQLTS